MVLILENIILEFASTDLNRCAKYVDLALERASL